MNRGRSQVEQHVAGPAVVAVVPQPASDAHRVASLEGLAQSHPVVLDAGLVVGALVPTVHTLNRRGSPVRHRGCHIEFTGSLKSATLIEVQQEVLNSSFNRFSWDNRTVRLVPVGEVLASFGSGLP